ncbi:hypothetical protein SFRURICE_012768 [Spodoptera frugiperda]|nr:hypothetical protein SFRURICE_012768 [Spodoptera frugiperda]
MILAVLIVLFCALLALWNKMKPRGPSPPVYPGALPILGHAHQLYGDPIYFWTIQKKMYQFSLDNGGVSEIRFGPHSVYMVTDPDDSLVIANTCLNKPYYYDFAKEMFNRGLVTASCELKITYITLCNPQIVVSDLGVMRLQVFNNDMETPSSTVVPSL